MAELLASMKAEWWRADGYEIVDGCFAPVAGSRVSIYDPMAIYWESNRERFSARKKKVKAPYHELIDILNELRWEFGADGQAALPRGGQERLLHWVRRNGLLGALPHTVLHVTGTYEKETSTGQESRRGSEVVWARDVDDPDRPAPGMLAWHRGALGQLTASVEDLESLNDLSAGANTPAGRSDAVHISHRELGEEVLTEKPWSEAAAPFFPHPLRQRFGDIRYPLPHEPDFWKNYREPISVFLRGVSLLRWSLFACARATGVRDPDILDDEGIHEWTGPAALNLLLSRVRPALRPLGAGWEGHWRSPSLLSILAVQMYWDMSRGTNFRAGFCGHCNTPFATRTPGKKYCGDNCRKEAYRRRKKVGAPESETL